MSPKDVFSLVPRTCEYVALHGQREFVDVITLRLLRWEDYPGFSDRLNVIIIIKRSVKEKGWMLRVGKRRVDNRSRGRREALQRRRSQKPRNVGCSRSRKTKKLES